MKRFICFDQDGVLVDTEYWYYKSNVRALSKLGIELDKTMYLDYMSEGRSCWELARERNLDKSTIAKSREDRNAYYQNYLRTENIEIPGVELILQELSKNYRMCIVTTSKRSDFELIHKDRSIVDNIEFVLTLEDYKRSKPNPDPYLKALEIFGSSKSETVVVEDSRRGLKSAVAAEIDCIIVENEFTKSHDFSTANIEIKSLSQLSEAILQLDEKS